jgi:hypothetical protein
MADLSITAANVATVTGGSTSSGTAGVTITAGQLVYLDSVSSTIKLADANASITAADCVGVALHGSLAGQPIVYQTGGDYTTGGTNTVGEVYVVSATAGGIAPRADLASGWYTKVWMIAKTAAIATIVNKGASTLTPVP